MGCGQSQVNPGDVKSDQAPGEKPTVGQDKSSAIKNGNVSSGNSKSLKTDSNANRSDKTTSNPVPKSVAFVVTLDGQVTDNKLIGPPPPRLQRLDPLNIPKLTAEELAEKQRLADEKREAELSKRQSYSKKSSRRRLQILEAQKFETEQQQLEKDKKIQESLESAGKSREAKLRDVQERQRIRQERANRAREKVKKLNQLDQDVDIDVEKDDTYNADDVDSWLDGDNNNNKDDEGQLDQQSADSQERIYSGRTSPKKRYNGNSVDNALRRGTSENTIDSFDNAYSRKVGSASKSRNNVDTDDFFDT